MSIWKRLIALLIISTCCIGCDQTSKYYASGNLPRNTMNSYLGDTIRIGYTENRGAFLGLGKNLPENTRFFVLTVLSSIFLLGFLLYLLISKSVEPYSLVALALIFSGGASNVFDRAMNDGAVIDFLNVGIASFRTGIFNIADIAILLGSLLFVVVTYPERNS